MHKWKIATHCLLTLAILAILVAGCKPQVAEQPEVPPEIPPISTFLMDFDDFSPNDSVTLLPGSQGSVVQLVSFVSGDSNTYASEQYAIGARKNWGFAVLNVGFWSVVIVVGMALPVASFVESFNHTPEQQSDYTWIWAYDVPVDGAMYTAELHGRYIDNGVRWEMYVSKENEYSDFQWYYGESDLPATEGFWILKKNPADATDFIEIDWERDITDGSHSIKYTNILPGGPENGGYILHGITAEDVYDRYYEIYNKGKDNYTYIEWNNANKEGRVKDSRHFGDEEWHCWDAGYLDIECE